MRFKDFLKVKLKVLIKNSIAEQVHTDNGQLTTGN